MRPVVPAPSDEMLALARSLVEDRRASLRADDPLLQRAARRVAQELDDYDDALIARAARAPEGSGPRRRLIEALARRIASARLELAAHERSRAK